MKKKLAVVMMVFVLILSGCGAPNYRDGNLYYDEFTNKVNELDPDYIKEVNGILDTLEIKDEVMTFKGKAIDLYSAMLSKETDEEIQVTYDDFEAKISEAKDLADLGITNTTEELKSAQEEISNMGEKRLNITKNLYSKSLSFVNDNIDGLTKKVNDMSREELESYGDAEEFVKDYVQESDIGTKLKDGITEIIKGSME